jgi:hypothetical protein
LNFSQIEKGVDSFELRLWSSVATTDFNFLTILKYSDSTWHLTETRYWIENVKNYPNADLMMLDSSKTKLNFPTRSFEKIIDSIESFRIDLIPSQHQIAGFMDKTADGAYYTLEVATKRYYKLLSYHNPKYYEDSSNKRVVELLNFLERDLRAFVMN